MSGAMRLGEWLAENPFTLAMSSGFFSFFAHGGMLAALEENGLRPDAVAGSSAGALTGGLWAAGLHSGTIRELYFSLRRSDFWDPSPGLGLLRGRRLRSMIRGASPVGRLEECRRPARVSAFDLLRLRTRVLDSGDLADALYASCAVPFMFQPIRMDGGLLVDGGVADRPGMAGIPEGARVFYHHIASRSPWRRRNSPALRIPRRRNMAAIRGLPRPGPGNLGVGMTAWAAAREATIRALDRPVGDGIVEMLSGDAALAEEATMA